MAEEEKPKATFIQYLGLVGYKLLCAILRMTDIRLVALFGRCIGYLVWLTFPSRRAIVARNMRIVINPTLRPAQLSSMVRRNIIRTSMNLACSLKTGQMTAREMEKSISVLEGHVFEDAGINGQTAIACIPHAGNWEILARIRPLFKKIEHFGSMYRRMSNPLLEEMVYRSRTSYGCEMFSKEEGLKAVLKLARSGGLLGVLSDQFTQEGLFLPYFGKVTGVTPLPALLYKRCKGKGTLFAIFTRNTALGKWDAVMDRVIKLPEGCDSIEEITQHVNFALEKCQSENILDGFWMHHRWKSTREFAPANAFNNELIRQNVKLPFRAIICMPESFDEAALLLPILRMLKATRVDMQLTVLCPEEQKAYWQKHSSIVTYVTTTDGATSPIEQLESDELYKDGPYDLLFMFSENKRVFHNLKALMPIYISGFENNPLAKKFRSRYPEENAAPNRNRVYDYITPMVRTHSIQADIPAIFAPESGNASATGSFIAPFSTLGSADSWPKENWIALAQKLGKVTLLALPVDADKANALAAKLSCNVILSKPEEVSNHLGPNTTLYAVDGLLPTLAAQVGARCNVIMASRDSQRYGLITGENHRILSNHTPCHPCYNAECDQHTPCTCGVSVDEMLG